MPKNNKYNCGHTSSVLYQCPCGFEKMSNDIKSSKICMERHRRYCSVGKEIKGTDVLQMNNTHSEDSSRVRTYFTSAPKEVVATFNK